MNHTDYPALYKSASDLSAEAQNSFFRALKWHIGFLITAAIISVVNPPCSYAAIVQVLVLLGALGCAIYLFSAKPDRHWYSARALAESVKTSTWRYITKAEPFTNPDEQDRHYFVLRLKQVLQSNKDIAGRLSTHLDESQISDEMTRVRLLSTAERQEYYRDHRVVEQLTWYARKSKFNKTKATIYYSLLFAVISIAIVFAICKVKFPQAAYWPTDVFVTSAASLLSWIQAKRYQELAISYSLTAHEIGFIRQEAASSMSDTELSVFVGDAENAFSREHTQWVARRDA
ncbi:DUF4231 domain-containing protein [Pseudomonas nitroreducens]|uniref:DUF4231 domain-containing protein n=1 Tax=Pseudomonas nitroreducens TaxID=46680 RepID=UPI003D29DE14